ncbi:MAG: M48 family peptidase, partial [Balneolaceae bacterium]
MNIYILIILAAIAVDFILDITSNYLNLKALSKKLPEEFEGVYDEETYAKSQEYTKVGTRFGFIIGLFDLALLLGFWFSGGFNWLDQIVRGWEFSELFTGLTYIAILMVAKTIIKIPFSIYSTFVIEERFGFNKTTPKTFVMDMMKGLGLGLVIGMPLLAGILAFFMYAGNLAWLYAWAAVTVFTLIM